jgi:hypothetical protein
VKHEDNGDVSAGRIFPNGEEDTKRYFHPNDASIELTQRRKLIANCQLSLHLGVKTAVALTGLGALKGVRDRSARELVVISVSGAVVATGARVVEEICSQTVKNIDGRLRQL